MRTMHTHFNDVGAPNARATMASASDTTNATAASTKYHQWGRRSRTTDSLSFNNLVGYGMRRTIIRDARMVAGVGPGTEPEAPGRLAVALGDLSPDQLAAVTTPSTLVAVIAGAGSGKTRVLT